MHSDMNSWQEVIYDVLFARELVTPKRIAYRLHKYSDYLSDICRRERVDPFAVANEILKEVEPLAATNLCRYLEICRPILTLLLDGTSWMPVYVDPDLTRGIKYNRLCEETGILCEVLGGAIKALARIEADGTIDETDDAEIASCQHKIGILVQRLNSLAAELHRRRAAARKEARNP